MTPEVPAAPDARFTPGVRGDISHADYLSIDALSSTGIKRLLEASPYHYRYDQLHPTDDGTASMAMGTALHMGILEPDRFDAGAIAVIPEDAPKRPTAAQWGAAKPSPASRAAMDFWLDFNAKSAGMLVLTAAQAASVAGMVRSVRGHPLYDELFRSEGANEVTFQWLDARLAIPCKARFDRLRADGLAIDIKSTRDASPDGFARAAASYRYHIQHAWYNNGHEHLRGTSVGAFLFLAVENEAPYGCALYVLQSNAVRFAVDECERAMLLYAQALKTGYWRSYPEGVAPLVLPRWAVQRTIPE